MLRRNVVDWPIHSDSDPWVEQFVARERAFERAATQQESRRRAACYWRTYCTIVGLVALVAFLAGVFMEQIIR